MQNCLKNNSHIKLPKLHYLYTNQKLLMKVLYTLGLILLPLASFSQVKQIAFSQLSPASGMFFGAEMTTTTITVTLRGPSDRYLAFGFGTGMAGGNDAIIWSTLGNSAAPLQVRDHRMDGTGVMPPADPQQDWTVISNTVSGVNRTIVASRPLNTGDANDVAISFSNTTQNLFWAKSSTASNQLTYHGSGNRASGIVRNWVLVDQAAPFVSTFTPADNAAGVALTADLTISFNENIAFGTGSISLYDENNALVQTVSNGSPGLTISNSTLVWNPTANLVVNTDYHVQIDPTAITDLSGNPFAGFTNNTTWNFNTNDLIAPTVSGAFAPADDAGGVSTTSNLSLTFSETVTAGTGTITIFNQDGSVFYTVNVPSAEVAVAGSVVTINPAIDLLEDAAYYIQITPGTITDLSGNDYAGISTQTAWNFNTNTTTPPVLAAAPFSPADNATGIAVNSPLTVTFNENIALTATGAVELFLANGTLVESFNSGSAGLTVNGAQLVISPSLALSEQTSYYVTIDAGLVTDLLGNAYAGFSDDQTWNFTTGDFMPPQFIASPFTPADNAATVPVSASLTAVFNEPVMFQSGSILIVDDTDGSGTIDYDVTTSPEVSISGNTLTINPSGNLEPATDYHVIIPGGAISDLSSNDFPALVDVTTWNFTTEAGVGIAELSDFGLSWNGTVLTLDPEAQVTGYIVDAAGKTVKTALLQTTHCADLISGVYFVRVQSESSSQSFRIYVR